MNDKINRDQLIRDKFENFSVEPPAHIWTNIQEQIAAKRKRTRMIYVGWISAAAVVVFAFIAGWLMNDRADSSSREMLSEQVVVQPVETAPENANKKPITDNEEVSSGEADLIPETVTEIPASRPASLLVAEKTVTEEDKKLVLTETVERVSYRMLQSIRGFANVENELTLAQKHDVSSDDEKTQTVDEISEADRLLIAANAKDYNKKSHSESAWIIGANVAPGYASHKTSYSNQYARNLNYDSSEGSGNVGGGLSVQYKTNDRLRVETGVYYSKNGMKSGSASSDLLYSASPSHDYTTGQPENVTGEDKFTNAVELRRGDILMNTAAGVVNITQTPANATLVSSNTLETGDYSSVISTEGRFSQNFDFVEIPLYLRYNVYDKKIGVDIMGGINAGLVVGNNAYIESNGSRQRIGSTEDISTLNIAGTVGVGLNYAISKHISLAVEPRFNYYLNSINTNPDVVYKPYRLGLHTGIYYQF